VAVGGRRGFAATFTAGRGGRGLLAVVLGAGRALPARGALTGRAMAAARTVAFKSRRGRRAIRRPLLAPLTQLTRELLQQLRRFAGSLGAGFLEFFAGLVNHPVDVL